MNLMTDVVFFLRGLIPYDHQRKKNGDTNKKNTSDCGKWTN